jgi:hypothetical protein
MIDPRALELVPNWNCREMGLGKNITSFQNLRRTFRTLKTHSSTVQISTLSLSSLLTVGLVYVRETAVPVQLYLLSRKQVFLYLFGYVNS